MFKTAGLPKTAGMILRGYGFTRHATHVQQIAVVAVLLLFAILATTYSIVTPLFEGYDEHWHYAYIQHIASGRGLPRQPPEQYHHLARQEASQPPLYYLLTSAVVRWLPHDDITDYLRENPQFGAIPWGYQDNQNIVIHTTAERFPYRGTVLAVHLVRLVSVLLGVGTVYCTYALARELFPREGAIALGAMTITALTPSFLFTSALANNDILIAFLASVTLVHLVRIWKGRISNISVVQLGILLGCAALAKLSGLFLWLFAGVILAALAWRKRDPRLLMKMAIPAFALATALSSWWYIRNWVLYRDLTALNMMLDITGRRPAGFGLRDVWAEFDGIRWSY